MRISLKIVSNHRPISLLDSENKLFEIPFFKYLFNHLLLSLQSGFIPVDSSVNRFTFLYNTFCQALDAVQEVWAVFCDLCKVFGRIWYAWFPQNLRAAAVSGDMLALFKSYLLSDRKQQVVLQDAHSYWTYIRDGVPWSSILGPILFLLYKNNIVAYIGSDIRLFHEDTSHFIIVDALLLMLIVLAQIFQKYRDGRRHG